MGNPPPSKGKKPSPAGDTAEAPFSLLWPAGSLTNDAGGPQLSRAAWHDLSLDTILSAIATDPEHQRDVTNVLMSLVRDPDVIRYRQEVIADLLANPGLTGRLDQLLPTIDALGRYSYRVAKDANTLHEITWRVGELQSIVDCFQALGEAFQEAGERVTSRGLRALREQVAQAREGPVFRRLVQELPRLLTQLRTCASVTIGVNLDAYLRPVEAVLLSVNEEKFTSQSLLNRLFGKNDGSTVGIAPLHTVPKRVTGGPVALPVESDLGWAVEPLMVPLFDDLAKVIEKTSKPIAGQLKEYAGIRGRIFVNLRQDLIFYLGAVHLIQRLQEHGFPLCRPEMAPGEERVCEVEGAYNLGLALHLIDASGEQNPANKMTLNEVFIGPRGRILILTGPNRGGKTTYLQSVGILQVLAQAGLFIPGRRSRISPVDNVFTHFPIEEKPDADTGRFGEEARRLGEIFQQVTRYSLALLNESLASTSAGESLYLAQDIVRVMRRMGMRAIYSTHLHELADQVDELNDTTPGDSRLLSIVSSPVAAQAEVRNELERNYQVEARPPLGRSYAKEIAARYGISYEQLEKILVGRGVLKEE